MSKELEIEVPKILIGVVDKLYLHYSDATEPPFYKGVRNRDGVEETIYEFYLERLVEKWG